MNVQIDPAPSAGIPCNGGCAPTERTISSGPDFSGRNPASSPQNKRSFSETNAVYSAQVIRLLVRADRLNSDLRLLGIDTAHPEELVFLAGRQSELAGSPQGRQETSNACLDYIELGNTLSRLRHGYRRILVQEDLPPATAQEVLMLAQLLDKTAGRLGFY